MPEVVLTPVEESRSSEGYPAFRLRIDSEDHDHDHLIVRVYDGDDVVGKWDGPVFSSTSGREVLVGCPEPPGKSAELRAVVWNRDGTRLAEAAGAVSFVDDGPAPPVVEADIRFAKTVTAGRTGAEIVYGTVRSNAACDARYVLSLDGGSLKEGTVKLRKGAKTKLSVSVPAKGAGTGVYKFALLHGDRVLAEKQGYVTVEDLGFSSGTITLETSVVSPVDTHDRDRSGNVGVLSVKVTNTESKPVTLTATVRADGALVEKSTVTVETSAVLNVDVPHDVLASYERHPVRIEVGFTDPKGNVLGYCTGSPEVRKATDFDFNRFPERVRQWIETDPLAPYLHAKDSELAKELGPLQDVIGYSDKGDLLVPQLEAAWKVLLGLKLRYASNAVMVDGYQNVENPSRLLSLGCGNCAEFASLFNSAMFQLGLDPVCMYGGGHVISGIEIPDTVQKKNLAKLPVIDIGGRTVMPVDATGMSVGYSFADAVKEGAKYFKEHKDEIDPATNVCFVKDDRKAMYHDFPPL